MKNNSVGCVLISKWLEWMVCPLGEISTPSSLYVVFMLLQKGKNGKGKENIPGICTVPTADWDSDCRHVMSANGYIARLRDLLGIYTRKCTSCSSSHWFLFFLSRMLLEICTACFKNEREIELMTSKTWFWRNSEIYVVLNFKLSIRKLHTGNQQLEMSGSFVVEGLSVTTWSCGYCNN